MYVKCFVPFKMKESFISFIYSFVLRNINKWFFFSLVDIILQKINKKIFLFYIS